MRPGMISFGSTDSGWTETFDSEPIGDLNAKGSAVLFQTVLGGTGFGLAIVVWHFYGVIFDPDPYAIDTAFLTGVSVREHGAAPDEEAEEKEREPEETAAAD